MSYDYLVELPFPDTEWKKKKPRCYAMVAAVATIF